MKTKNTLFLFLFLFLTVRAFSDVSIMAENARDYRNAIDELILDFIQTEAPPKLDKALRIQAYENNMLSWARLDPASARNMPNLLLANEVRLRDLRNLPGELIVARAREAGPSACAASTSTSVPPSTAWSPTSPPSRKRWP